MNTEWQKITIGPITIRAKQVSPEAVCVQHVTEDHRISTSTVLNYSDYKKTKFIWPAFPQGAPEVAPKEYKTLSQSFNREELYQMWAALDVMHDSGEI